MIDEYVIKMSVSVHEENDVCKKISYCYSSVIIV